MNRIFCSVGAVIGRANGMNINLLDECRKKLNCDGFEFLMSRMFYEKAHEIAEFMQSFDAPVPVFHADKNIGSLISRNGDGDTAAALEQFEINCDLARRIGSNMLVLHLWGGPDSDKDIEHNFKAYEKLLATAESYGLCLTVENIVCNNFDPLTHLSAMAQRFPHVLFTYDTKMAEFHGQLTDVFEENFKQIVPRIAHLHINDYSGGIKDWANLKTRHLGDGQIDFARFFASVKEMNYMGDYTVECTAVGSDGTIDFGSLNRDFEMIRKHIG